MASPVRSLYCCARLVVYCWYCRCLCCPCVRVSISTLITRFTWPTWGQSGADSTQVGPMLAPWTLLSGQFVRAITDHVFKLGLPNLDQQYKGPWLRPILYCGMIAYSTLEVKNWPHFEFVPAVTHHLSTIGFPNYHPWIKPSAVDPLWVFAWQNTP